MLDSTKTMFRQKFIQASHHAPHTELDKAHPAPPPASSHTNRARNIYTVGASHGAAVFGASCERLPGEVVENLRTQGIVYYPKTKIWNCSWMVT